MGLGCSKKADLIWFDLIWFDLIWFDLIWFDVNNDGFILLLNSDGDWEMIQVVFSFSELVKQYCKLAWEPSIGRKSKLSGYKLRTKLRIVKPNL